MSSNKARTTLRILVLLAVPGAALLTSAVLLIRVIAPVASSAASQPCPSFASPTLVPVGGAVLGDIRFDESCTHVYVSNPTLNEIEVYSLQTRTLEAPILVGSKPIGFDITPDGNTMYVANSGGWNISVVDLATKQELRKIQVNPTLLYNDEPLSIAIANNGKALFTTTFSGSGFGGRMMQLDLGTEVVSQRTDFWYGGSTTQATFLRSSLDRTKIGIVDSTGAVFTYTSATDHFIGPANGGSGGYRGYIATDTSGSVYLVGAYPGTQVFDANLNLLGSISLSLFEGNWGVAVKPDGKFGYRVVADGVDILDLTRFLSVGTLPIGESVGTPHPALYPGRMAISADGSLLAVNGDSGFSLLEARTTPPPTATPTNTATPTMTPTASPTPTPGVPAEGARSILGISGTFTFGDRFDPGGSVSFARPLKDGDYAVLLTPENRSCNPQITAKSPKGFAFSCQGVGGAVDWLVVSNP